MEGGPAGRRRGYSVLLRFPVFDDLPNGAFQDETQLVGRGGRNGFAVFQPVNGVGGQPKPIDQIVSRDRLLIEGFPKRSVEDHRTNS